MRRRSYYYYYYIDILWRICKLIWTKGERPKDWCRAVFIPIPKKGNLKECSNYRTIRLIVHASNVLLKIIKGRIKLHYAERWQKNRLVLWKEKELENK